MVGAVEATSRPQGATGKWHAIDKAAGHAKEAATE